MSKDQYLLLHLKDAHILLELLIFLVCFILSQNVYMTYQDKEEYLNGEWKKKMLC